MIFHNELYNSDRLVEHSHFVTTLASLRKMMYFMESNRYQIKTKYLKLVKYK